MNNRSDEKTAYYTDNIIDSIIDIFPDQIYLMDNQERIVTCNEQQAKIFGLPSKQVLIGKDIYDVAKLLNWEKSIPDKIHAHNLLVLEKEQSLVEEEEIIVDNKKHSFLVRKSPLRDNNNAIIGIVGISIDITDQKEAEALRIENAEKQDKAEKELGRIAAQVAHDMRSPLLAVDSFFQLIERKLEESERVFGKRAISRLNDIAWSLLSKYKHKEEKTGLADDSYVFLHSCLQELLSEKRMEYIKTSVAFEFFAHADNSFDLVYVNVVNLKRALSNLINNAVNAILPNAGRIAITLENTIFGSLIIIKDNGCGMKPEILNSIMEAAKSEKAKTNLGLPHAIKFMDNIGGQLEMASTEGQGTTVYVTLPHCQTPAWCVKHYSVRDDELLLIIDDSQSVHDVWNEMLKKMPGVQNQHLYNPDEALDFFNTTTHKNLVIFCDYEFVDTEKNGVDVLSHAPETAKRFLVTSHLYDPKIMQVAIDKGFNILPKDLVSYFRLHCVTQQDLSGDIQLIFIDNEERNTDSWLLFAQMKNMKIAVYNHPDDFFKDAAHFNKQIPVYIDLNLDLEKDGVAYAKDIHALGFERIYIATGDVAPNIKRSECPWITGIIEKRFPFL